MNPFTKLRAYLTLRQAINQAEQAHAQNGMRYYVMPAGEKLLIMNRQDLKQLRRKHYTSPHATTHDLLRHCFYHTAHANGTGAMSALSVKARKMLYYKWYVERKETSNG